MGDLKAAGADGGRATMWPTRRRADRRPKLSGLLTVTRAIGRPGGQPPSREGSGAHTAGGGGKRRRRAATAAFDGRVADGDGRAAVDSGCTVNVALHLCGSPPSVSASHCDAG